MNSKVIAQSTALINTFLMPDSVTVTPRSGDNPSIDVYGNPTSDVPVARMYNASSAIPCRIDTSTSYRPDGTQYQTTDVEEYSIEFPGDFNFEETDIVTIDGKDYEIKKVTRASNWHLTQTALVMGLVS